ncbi:MAG: porin [Bacteroidetes bacterium]|nr:porin [Bacteroidota bacterium]
MLRNCALLIFCLSASVIVSAQTDTTSTKPKTETKKWYDAISVKGYAQVRYNRLGETNPDLRCDQCDKSWGNNGGLFLRRSRLVISGQVHPRVYFYMQTDFANNVSSGSATGQHFAQLRDAYIDLSLDKSHVYKFRFGQSKIPYGFDNLQSSQVRLTIDRTDAMNSGTFNERDMGVFFMYTPKKVIETYKEIIDNDLKGSGNYGLFSVGVYNGQTANKVELNNELHAAARLTYPIRIKSQITEFSVMGYTGQYVMPKDLLSTGVKTNSSLNYTDKRAAGSFVLYPKPFGIQAEYTVGMGPTYNDQTDSIEVAPLKGGYVTLCYKTSIKKQSFIPFARYQYYQGGKKLEKDARNYLVREFEAGVEWQPYKNFELTAVYVYSDRKYTDFTTNYAEFGSLIRLQVQLNF